MTNVITIPPPAAMLAAVAAAPVAAEAVVAAVTTVAIEAAAAMVIVPTRIIEMIMISRRSLAQGMCKNTSKATPTSATPMNTTVG